MDEQVTLASFFSTVLAFLNGFLIFVLLVPSLLDRFYKLLWSSIGCFFFLLSLDEYFELHEFVNTIIMVNVLSHNDNSILYLARYSWIFPLLIFILGVMVAFILLIKREKNNAVRIPLIAVVFSYVVILFLEIVGGSLYGQYIYKYFIGVEEGLEMISSIIFLKVLFEKMALLR